MSQGKLLAEIAAANKAGLVNKGYCADKYARYFVPKVVHYSPVVHKEHFTKSRFPIGIFLRYIANQYFLFRPFKMGRNFVFGCFIDFCFH